MPMRLRRPSLDCAKLLARAIAVILCGWPASIVYGAAPLSTDGDVGRTSYLSLPFQSQVYGLCWSCSPNLEPAELFFHVNPRSPFNDRVTMAETHRSVNELEKSGVVPSAGVQRWEGTFASSFDEGTFKNEPDWVASDRSDGLNHLPEFTAWRDWIAGHPQYHDMAADGGTMPIGFRSWGGSWGHISPLTRLDRQDCPPKTDADCDWGDLYAHRWSRVSAKSGAYGMILSDFSDSQPGFASNIHDFNPRIVSAFLAYSSSAEAGTSSEMPTPALAESIVSNHFDRWNDFIAGGYSKFYAALIQRIGAVTGKQPLIVDQCARTPAFRRLFGIDARIIAQKLPARNYLCMWDDHVVQADRQGPIDAPPMQELAGFVLAAAREPSIRNGANLEADDAAFWTGIAKFYPSLDAAGRREIGLRLLKRLWVWSAWAHIADRSGKVRRALALTSRDYWDSGSLALLDPLAHLIQSIAPARPYGPALYYSVAVERAVEAGQGRAVGTRDEDLDTYLPAGDLQLAIDGGAPVGYYVSDAALGSIRKADPANAPSAWIVLGAADLLPADERAALLAVAPIATSLQEASALPWQPLKLPPGLAGFAFYDAAGRLLIVISNPSTAPDAQSVGGTVQLAGLQIPDGPLDIKELLTGTSTRIVVAAHQATFPVNLERWDTAVFSLSAS